MRSRLTLFAFTLVLCLIPSLAFAQRTLSCPASQSAVTDGTFATINYPTAAASGQPTPIAIGYSQKSGTAFPVGVTTVTVTARWKNGQTIACQFTVTVKSSVPPPPAPVNCVLSDWTLQLTTPWSACDSTGHQSCTQTWTRTVLTPPANGGQACGPLAEQRTVTQACPVAPPPPPTPTPPLTDAVAIGKGCTTAWYIDEDCDGYGVGVRSSGLYGDVGLGDKPDADDSNAALNTPASVLAAYDANKNGTLDASELKAFLVTKGIAAGNIYYLSLTGNNATGAPNDPAKPYATYHTPPAGTTTYGVWQYLQPGDVVIYQGGIYKDPYISPMKSGATGKPIVLMSAPGERVDFQIMFTPLESTGASYVIVDGFTFDTPENLLRGYGIAMGNTSHAIFRNIETQRFAYTSHIDNMHDIVAEHWVVHHNLEHGVYMGARNLPSSDITFRRSILYKNGTETGYGNFQYNGRVTNLVFEDNILHSSGQWGISFKQGVSNSIVRNNLLFNNGGHGIIFDLYDGDCVVTATEYREICPYSQNNNLVTNNAIWIGKYTLTGVVPMGNIPLSASAILVAHNTTAVKCPNAFTQCDQGHNTFQNNIITVQDGYAFKYVSNNPTADGATVAGWLATTTIRNNVLNRAGGSGAVIAADASVYSFSAFTSTFPAATGNVFGDPKFVRASIDDWGAPQAFNLRLAVGSPAIGIGLASGTPPLDISGGTRKPPFDAGAYASAPPVSTTGPTVAWSVPTIKTGTTIQPGFASYISVPYDPVSRRTLHYVIRDTTSGIYSTDLFAHDSTTQTFTHLGGTGSALSLPDLTGITSMIQPWPGDRHPNQRLVVDTSRNVLWMVGGVAANHAYTDTWQYSLHADPTQNRWTRVDDTLPTNAPVVEGSLVRDPVSDVLILAGMAGASGFWTTNVFCPSTTSSLTAAQTAAGCLSPNVWATNITAVNTPPPGYVDWPELYYDSTRHKVEAFLSGNVGLRQIWEYDVLTRTYTNRTPASGMPVEATDTSRFAPELNVIQVTSGPFAGSYVYHQTSHLTASDFAKDYLYDPVANAIRPLTSTGTGPTRLIYAGWDAATNTIVAWGYNAVGGGQIWYGVLQ
jgi:hypothetical protein